MPIHPSAIVDSAAQIDSSAEIGPYSIIGANVRIGARTVVKGHVFMEGPSEIGEDNVFFPYSTVGVAPQDLKYKGGQSTVSVGDNTVIRECVTLNRGTALDKNTTTIGSNCLLMAYVHVAHDCIIGNNCVLVNAVQVAGHVTVGDYAIIGGLTAVKQFIRIGAHTYIGGQSAIRKDVPPYVKAAREPISYMGLNIVGLQRRNFAPEKIKTISDVYHLLFVQNNNFAKAIDLIETKIPDGEVKTEILEFVKNSKNGIIKRPSKNGLIDED